MMNGGVIIGAGVAGVAAGIFAQKRGLQLPIYERAAESAAGNHLLWIAPNGQRILARLGLLEQEQEVFLSFLGHAKPLVHSYVIAADGMGSLVRSTIFPGSRVSHQGLRTWLGECVTPVAASFVGTTTEAWGNGTNELAPRLDQT